MWCVPSKIRRKDINIKGKDCEFFGPRGIRIITHVPVRETYMCQRVVTTG